MATDFLAKVGTGCLLAFLVGTVHAETPDVLLDYVESTGLQAVDTGVTGRYDTKVEMRLTWLEINTDTCLLGARGNDGTEANPTRLYLVNSTWNEICFGCGAYVHRRVHVDGMNDDQPQYWEANRTYTYVVDVYKSGSTLCKIATKVDGTDLPTYDSGYIVDTQRPLYLFAANNKGAVDLQAKARVHACKIWQDGTLRRDFRPCLKNGRPGLYDKVSRQIFYSITGTDLVCDPHPNKPDHFVEYVDSDGSAYLDTGVRARSGARCETDMAWLALGGDYAFLDARTSNSVNERIFLLHSYNYGQNVGYGTFLNNPGTGTFSVNTRYHVESELRTGHQRLKVDGTTVYSASDGATYDTGLSFYLFANNIAGEPNFVGTARVYTLKMWLDDELVRDFRPCVKNGRAALYDAVSDVIFFPERGELKPAPIIETDHPDYLVEYIDSPDYTYLDTGVRGRSGTRAVGEVAWTRIFSIGEHKQKYLRDAVDGGEASFLAACASDGGRRFYLIHSPNGEIWSGYGDDRNYVMVPRTNTTYTVVTNVVGDAEVVTTNVSETVEDVRYYITKNTRYTIDADYQAGSQILKIDGSTVLSESNPNSVDAGGSLYVFACNKGGTPVYRSNTRCYSLKIWQDGVLVRDFKPCMRNGQAGLYDAVEGRIHYTLKPVTSYGYPTYTNDMWPVKRLEYVESDGRQWIDTGVIGRSGTVADFRMQWLEENSGADVTFLGARKDGGNTRFFMWHLANSSFAMGYGIFHYLKPGDPSFWGNTWQGEHIPAEKHRTYHVRTSLLDGAARVEVDGELLQDTEDSALNVDTGNSLYVFACNFAGNASYPSKARFYSLKLWQDGVLVRDFRPVELNCGLPALWDRIEDRVYPPNVPFSAVGPVTETIRQGNLYIYR